MIKRFRPHFINLVLDPRLKLIHFKKEGLLFFYPLIKQDIITLFKFEYNKVKNEINKNKWMINLNIAFNELNDNIYNIPLKESDSDNEFYYNIIESEDEYLVYLNESIILLKIYLLDFWKQNQYRFPILSTLARRYLAIPVSSGLIESIFSIGTNIITKSQNRLLPKTTKQLILLKSWKIKTLEDLQKLENEVEELDENEI